MNILLQAREKLYDDPGGDSIQISKYREYLEKSGCPVKLSLDLAPDLKNIDIVHGFNIQVTDQTYRQIRHAKDNGKQVVFSPIYWNMEEYLEYRLKNSREAGSYFLKEKFKKSWGSHYDCLQNVFKKPSQAKVLRRLMVKGKRTLQKECLELADLILVSSVSEKNILLQDFGMNFSAKVRVLPNGVEPIFYKAEASPFVQEYGQQDFLLCVGRMDPHKNQLAVIRAAREMNISLVLIGPQPPTPYLKFCQKAAGPKTSFWGRVSHENLPAAYAAARAHILASWFDIPGLVNLEAGLAGCNVISTNRGSAADYLGENAWYLDPGDDNSIRNNIEMAMQSPRDSTLPARLLEHYSWEKITRHLCRYYQEILRQG